MPGLTIIKRTGRSWAWQHMPLTSGRQSGQPGLHSEFQDRLCRETLSRKRTEQLTCCFVYVRSRKCSPLEQQPSLHFSWKYLPVKNWTREGTGSRNIPINTELGRGRVAEILLFTPPRNFSVLLFDFLAKFPHTHADMACTFFHGGIILDMPCPIPIAIL